MLVDSQYAKMVDKFVDAIKGERKQLKLFSINTMRCCDDSNILTLWCFETLVCADAKLGIGAPISNTPRIKSFSVRCKLVPKANA